MNTQQNRCASHWKDNVHHLLACRWGHFPKREGRFGICQGSGVKSIRLNKINLAAPHNPSGLSHEVKGYRCLSKGFGRCGQVKGHGCKAGVFLCLCLPQVPLVLSNLLSSEQSEVVFVMSSISRSNHFWCSIQEVSSKIAASVKIRKIVLQESIVFCHVLSSVGVRAMIKVRVRSGHN